MTSEREEDFAWEEQGVWLAVLAVLAVLSLEEQGAVEAGQVCYPHHP